MVEKGFCLKEVILTLHENYCDHCVLQKTCDLTNASEITQYINSLIGFCCETGLPITYLPLNSLKQKKVLMVSQPETNGRFGGAELVLRPSGF